MGKTTITTEEQVIATRSRYEQIADAIRPHRATIADAVRDAIYDDDIAPITAASTAIEDADARAVAFGLAVAAMRAAAGVIPADDDGTGMGAAAESARQAVIKAWR